MRIVANRVYDCSDCIDVKDEMSDVWVTDNDAFWCAGHGIVTSSSATLARNVVAAVEKTCLTPWLGWGHEPQRWFNVWDNACVDARVSCVQVSGANAAYAGGQQAVTGFVDANTCVRAARAIALWEDDSELVDLEFVVRNNVAVDTLDEPDEWPGVKPAQAAANRWLRDAAAVFRATDLRRANALVPRAEFEAELSAGVARNATDLYQVPGARTTRLGAVEPLSVAGVDEHAPLLPADAELPEIDIGAPTPANTVAIVVVVVVLVLCCGGALALYVKSRGSRVH